ncbi:hypothetical protein [Legionella sp.]|uniref:hypothetical protein n=1 Tax=Legionella sp. TaxID=459 RepID=UPI000CC38B9D|nr:hypothetical protein [Legionella sp.]PJE12287.1 MAG: hypothetical protein CK430_07775 [Legionella sp.]
MSIEDKVLDKNTKDAGAKIVKVAKWVLTVDDFYIKGYLEPAVAMLSSVLSGVEERNYLATLEDEHVLVLRNQLETSLLRISDKVDKMKDKLALLKDINSHLDSQISAVKEVKQKNEKTINDKQAELENTSRNQQATFWSSYLADNNPGFFKSIFLFFIPQSSIDEAKKVCNYLEKSRGLPKEIQALRETNKKLDDRLDTYECQYEDIRKQRRVLNALESARIPGRKVP